MQGFQAGHCAQARSKLQPVWAQQPQESLQEDQDQDVERCGVVMLNVASAPNYHLQVHSRAHLGHGAVPHLLQRPDLPHGEAALPRAR